MDGFINRLLAYRLGRFRHHMIRLRLIFKKHGEVITRNLTADDALDERELWKYANKTTQERWPKLAGTLQDLKIEGR